MKKILLIISVALYAACNSEPSEDTVRRVNEQHDSVMVQHGYTQAMLKCTENQSFNVNCEVIKLAATKRYDSLLHKFDSLKRKDDSLYSKWFVLASTIEAIKKHVAIVGANRSQEKFLLGWMRADLKDK